MFRPRIDIQELLTWAYDLWIELSCVHKKTKLKVLGTKIKFRFFLFLIDIQEMVFELVTYESWPVVNQTERKNICSYMKKQNQQLSPLRWSYSHKWGNLFDTWISDLWIMTCRYSNRKKKCSYMKKQNQHSSRLRWSSSHKWGNFFCQKL